MGMATGGDASDQQRFALIYQSNYAPIHAYVARRLRDRGLTDDVTAEVFTVAWRRLDDIPSPIGGWLFGVARNVVMATNRATVPDPLDLVEEALAAREADPSARAVDRSELERVAEALATLSDSDRELLLLMAWEGLPLAQLAEALECSVAAAGVRLHRARQRLRRAVDHAGATRRGSTSTSRSSGTTSSRGRSAADRGASLPVRRERGGRS
ncbi:sigma-70 family RNA polymerase sigma factor [Intrasporangium calvum]|uniref:Sigma-70 family RNA polymerase sigma factor n=1 Tax=Intrasporangium calvum TaxID=53358 RepID=A0ABT5GIG6_9MICO|nr:sigma-70 family RNA polymerase sigma factor [Intrasporangium calvum]MDC5697987.1 sigma-70 family RNA polymerase sigma factor [Intrasporangium calvum]